MSEGNDPAIQKEFIQLLPSNENWVLTVMSVNDRILSPADIAKALNKLKIPVYKQSRWTSAIVKTCSQKLEKLDILEPFKDSHFLSFEWLEVAAMTTTLQHPQEVGKLVAYFYNLYHYQPVKMSRWRYGYYDTDYSDYSHQAHLLLLANDANEHQQVLHLLRPNDYAYRQDSKQEAFSEAHRLFLYFDAEFWLSRKPYFQRKAMEGMLFHPAAWTADTAPQLAIFYAKRERVNKEDSLTKSFRINLGMLAIHEIRRHPELLTRYKTYQGFNYLLQGQADQAAQVFAAIPSAKNQTEVMDVVRELVLYSQNRIHAGQMLQTSFQMKKSLFSPGIVAFKALANAEAGNMETAEEKWNQVFLMSDIQPLDWLLILWCASWTGFKPDEDRLDDLLVMLREGFLAYQPWLLGEITHSLPLIFPLHPEVPDWKAMAEEMEELYNFNYLQKLIRAKEPWEHALHILDLVTHDATAAEEQEQAFRNIWIVDFDREIVFAKEQKRGVKGWSKGRRLKWTDLLVKSKRQELTASDTPVLNAISTVEGRAIMSRYHYSEDHLQVDFGHVLYELVNHPRVYLGDQKRIPLDLRRGQAEMTVLETADGIQLSFTPSNSNSGYSVVKETPTRYVVYQLDAAQAKLSRSIGSGILIPEAQRTQLELKLPGLRDKVRIQSTLDLVEEDMSVYQGNSKVCVHLLPFGETYKLELYAKPLPEENIYYKPGDGLAKTILLLEEGRVILQRDLVAERQAVEELLTACPTLAALPHEIYEWYLKDTQHALQVLLELRPLQQEDRITLEHPKGEKLKLVSVMGSDDLRLRIGRQKDWFSVDGRLQVDENRVLDLEHLLAYARNQEQEFVELADGAFLALTEELKEKLTQMEGLLTQKGSRLELPTLAAGQFAELAEGLSDLEADEAWTESLERIQKAQKIRPRIPHNLEAELRDYQQEGYRWMMRLATWGVGACLADDMGLGKTVQALAVLCKRAELGPALVIAPASVTRNWVLETQKFAPDLRPILLSSSNDLVLLQQLDASDILIVSYGLLSFVGEELTTLLFSTIVLDEAQAIKNPATKRSKLVRQLQADFKLATTGTPIENNLGELWSLFRFLNPGLLGSKQHFGEKFEKPITKYQDEQRREQLRKLVRPFILRRRKDEVLTELPAKTEVVLNVTLSDEEQALYEAMRRQALKEIEDADEKSRRFTVLAQLTRLRQAACHPRLVRPRSKIGSAKLELIGETIHELLQNGHKALVFSQFVKHLKIVENWVQKQRISYQYLDGSTPGKKRQASVDAFQQGEGELFLISLKAGGTGLNLTEADYVLHLDPWWNPAVEDQASDRAHRIGQQKPVTVYRFVSENTIEEKIISLHADKRDLADQILSGTNQSGKLSVEEIMDLLR